MLIEDCAHILEGRVGGQPVGTFGVASFYSFEWGKPLVAGGGGGVRSEDPALLRSLREACSGLSRPPWKETLALAAQHWAYRYLLSGSTYWTIRGLFRWLSMQGAVLGNFRPGDAQTANAIENERAVAPSTRRRFLASLRKIGQITTYQRALSSGIEAGLRERGILVWSLPRDRDATLMRFPLLAKAKEELLEAARKERVELSGMVQTPIDPVPVPQAACLYYSSGLCPVAELISRTFLSVNIRLDEGHRPWGGQGSGALNRWGHAA